MRELAIFGGNTIELAHVYPGDAFETACLHNYSALLDKYDLDVHLWLPVDNAALPFTPAMRHQ